MDEYLGPSVYPLKGTVDRFYFTYWEYSRKGGQVKRIKRQQKRCPGNINSRRRAEQYADEFARRKYDEARDSRFKQQVPTLREYVEARHFFEWDRCDWIATQNAMDEDGQYISKPQAQARLGQLNNHILERWGDELMTDINPVAWESWLSKIVLSNKTRNSISYTGRIIFRTAHREDVIPFNPLTDIRRFGERSRERGTFTKEEVEKFFPQDIKELAELWCGLQNAIMAYLMYATGMRPQEIRASEADFVREPGVLVLQAVKEEGGIGLTKNKDRRATLTTERAADLLDRCPNSGLLFPGRYGQVLNRDVFRYPFQQALQVITVGDRWLTPYSFRHTWRTELKKMQMKGLIYKEDVDYMAGHRSEGVSAKYIHLGPEEALELLEEYRPAISDWLI